MNSIIPRIYYPLKPFIPRKWQIFIRRQIALRRMPKYSHVWPIDEKAGKAPEGWNGWPEGKKFALILTHDVETAEGRDKCLKLIELEKSLGFKSSFNFIAEEYEVLPALRLLIEQQGFEVGLHGLRHNGNLFKSKSEFQKNSKRINQYLKDWQCVGFRSPSMYHNLDWIGDLNIQYDSSTFDTDPFEPQPDGVSTIFPFVVNDGSTGKSYVELPYTLPQDLTLFVIMGEDGPVIWKKKLDWIAAHGGMALLITHPDYINFKGVRKGLDEYPAAYYEQFLVYVRDRYEGQYWQALPREVAKFWRERVVAEPRPVSRPVYAQDSRRPIRVCMLVYSFYESDNRVLRYAQTLARRGDHVDIIALRKDNTTHRETLHGVNVYRIQKREKNEKSQLKYAVRLMRFLFRSSWFIARQHFKAQYDLIHVHNMPDFLVFAALLPKLAGAKIIFDIHDVVPELYAVKFGRTKGNLLFRAMLAMEKVSCAFSDHVIIANHIWQKAVTDRSVSQKKCSVMLNYPDETIFYPRPRAMQDGKCIMIYPGSLNPRQGVDIAIRAFAMLKDRLPAAEFHIYGDGAGRTELEKLAAELGVQNLVLFKGSLPIYEVAERMAQADLGIEPKRNDLFAGDAMSTKILEFMSMGVPVIASDTRVHKYYFNDKVLRFFRSDDPKDLADCIIRMAGDEGYRRTLIAEGRDFAKDFFWDKKKEEYLRLVDVLTGNGSK